MKLAPYLMLALLPVTAMSALDIYTAPVLYVDETNDNQRDTDKVQNDLLAVLHTMETGMALQFYRLKDNGVNPPESLFDAVTVCRNERVEYLLYGYVTRREHNVTAELRLFEYSSRTVLQSFFAIDSPDHYDRMIADIAHKILQYVGETFKLDIITEKSEATRLAIPVMAGYWTSMDNNWINVMLGTVTAGSGFVFIPSDNMLMVRGVPWYFSTGLEVKYRLGISNPASYESLNHTLYLTLPVRLHIVFKKRHEVFIGLGYTYFLEFFSFADKYSDSKTYIYNNMGVYSGLGYRFALNRRLSIFFRNDFDFLFNEHSLMTYAPVLGLDIQIYEKEIRKQW